MTWKVYWSNQTSSKLISFLTAQARINSALLSARRDIFCNIRETFVEMYPVVSFHSFKIRL